MMKFKSSQEFINHVENSGGTINGQVHMNNDGAFYVAGDIDISNCIIDFPEEVCIDGDLIAENATISFENAKETESYLLAKNINLKKANCLFLPKIVECHNIDMSGSDVIEWPDEMTVHNDLIMKNNMNYIGEPENDKSRLLIEGNAIMDSVVGFPTDTSIKGNLAVDLSDGITKNVKEFFVNYYDIFNNIKVDGNIEFSEALKNAVAKENFFQENAHLGENDLELFSDNPEIIRITQYLDEHGFEKQAAAIRNAIAEWDVTATFSKSFEQDIIKTEEAMSYVPKDQLYIVHDARSLVNEAKSHISTIKDKLLEIKNNILNGARRIFKEAHLFGLSMKGMVSNAISASKISALQKIREDIGDKQVLLEDMRTIIETNKEINEQLLEEKKDLHSMAATRTEKVYTHANVLRTENEIDRNQAHINSIKRQEKVMASIYDKAEAKINKLDEKLQDRNEKIQNLMDELDTDKPLKGWLKNAAVAAMDAVDNTNRNEQDFCEEI